MSTTPEFITKLKERTIRTRLRGRVFVRPLNEAVAKLKQIADTEGVSQEKLVECAIELLHDKWSAERSA